MLIQWSMLLSHDTSTPSDGVLVVFLKGSPVCGWLDQPESLAAAVQ